MKEVFLSAVLPGEIVYKIMHIYVFNYDGVSYLLKGAQIAMLSKAWRDWIRDDRFNDVTVGYFKNPCPGTRTLMLNSSNAAKINREIVWTKKNKVDLFDVSYYISNLRYTDCAELVGMFLNTEPDCLTFASININVQNEYVRLAPASYLNDLARFLGMITRVTCYIAHGTINTLRFHSDRALESFRIMQVSLQGPPGTAASYASETMKDIARCKNCTVLFMFNSSFIHSASFRKLRMHLTRLSLDGCQLLTDDDFAWFLTANKATLTHFRFRDASCQTLKTWETLAMCTQMIDLSVESKNDARVPFPLIMQAVKQQTKLERLTVNMIISEATERSVLDLMLTYSRGGMLKFVDINYCIGLDDDSGFRIPLVNAYMMTYASIQMTLNARQILWTNPALDTYNGL